MSKLKLLDIETLEQLSFERSKMWGNFLNNFATQRDECEIPIASLEEALADEDSQEEDDDTTGSSSMDDSDILENDEVLQDITNRTRLGQVSPVRHVRSNTGSMALLRCFKEMEKDSEADSAELQDVLNQTRPLLEEHVRKWKEAGLDQVLNTFDPEKIEEKVGGWLRRNHSMASFSECSSKPLYARSHFRSPPHASAIKPRTCFVQDSDSESLHSVDTARYIRASRNRLEGRCRRFGSYSSKTSMTIKTFRMVQSKRDALREKYACLDSDETPHSANYFRRTHTRSPSPAVHAQRGSSTAKRVNVLRSAAQVTRSYRRKRLHKYRHSSSCPTSTSFSSSEDEYTGGARSTRRGELQWRRHWLPDTPSTHRWAPSCADGCRYLIPKNNSRIKGKVDRVTQCTRRTTEDKRPCKRESECACYHEGKLCKETRHIADTSTEDWVVEDCETPAKTQPQPVYQRKLAQSVPAKAHIQGKAPKRSLQYVKPAIEDTKNEEQCVDFEQPKEKSRKKGTAGKIKMKAKTKVANFDQTQPTKKTTNSKTQSKPTSTGRSKSTKNVISSTESSADSTFMRELEFAIENSKRTYEMERQKVTTTNAESAAHPSGSGLDKAAVSVPAKRGDLRSRQSSVDSVNSLGDNSSSSSSLRSLRPQPRSVKLRKMYKMLATEDTFFTHSRNICNSTALKGDTATTRQIVVERSTLPPIHELSGTPTPETAAKMKRPNKRVPIVSSTKQSSSSAASSSAAASAAASPNTESECIVVSSSTDLLMPKALRSIVAQPASRTDKGILLYAPDRRALTPAHSLRGGFFHVTLEHLGGVIGEQMARKFMKYYVGRRQFATSSSVYYRPPASPLLSTCAETDSDDDALERVGLYGDLYESFDKGSERR